MADLLRISYKGAMPSGEEWSVNPVYSIGGDFGTPVSSTQANAIAIAIAAIAVPTGLLAMMSPQTTVTGCRVEARTIAGALESQGEATKGTPTGGNASSGKTFQTSSVISLRSAHAGASGRGRLYWPATGANVNITSLRPAAADVTSWLASAKTLLSGIQTAIDATLDGVSLAVWSRTQLNLYPVTNIQMGDILDVQRRRRDQTVETYQTLTYP